MSSKTCLALLIFHTLHTWKPKHCQRNDPKSENTLPLDKALGSLMFTRYRHDDIPQPAIADNTSITAYPFTSKNFQIQNIKQLQSLYAVICSSNPFSPRNDARSAILSNTLTAPTLLPHSRAHIH